MWPMRLRRICVGCLVLVALVLACLLGASLYRTSGMPFQMLPHSQGDISVGPEQLLHHHHHHHQLQQLHDGGRRVRVLCWIMTQPPNYNSKAVAVNLTWAPRCDGYFFFSSEGGSPQPPPGLPVVVMKLKEDRDNLWDKTQAAFIYIYENHLNDYDFFLKADDDSYILVENLRHFLKDTGPSEPVFAGRRFRPYTKNGYMSGGGSYVLSRAAVKSLVEKAFRTENSFCRKHGGAEDVNMGSCLENVGVSILDSIDHRGRERFHPFDAASHIDFANWPKDFWLWKYNYHPIKLGLECCSSSAISFHYIKPVDMLTMHYLIYQLRAVGVSADSAGMGATGKPLRGSKIAVGRV